MKLNGKTLQCREYRTLELPRLNSDPIKLRVNSLPLGMKRDFELMCPRPLPPSVVVNKVGKPSEKIENYDDPQWIADISDYKDLERYFILFLALDGNDELEIEYRPTDVQSLKKFRDELKSSGLSEGDAGRIIAASMEASNIGNDEVKKAEGSF